MPLQLFLSNVTSRLDAKGRVSVPSAFRAILARDGFAGLYVCPSPDAQALECGGNALLERITGLLAGLAPFSQAHDSFSTALLGVSEILKLDPEGRMALPLNLKAHAGISQEVTFVGLGEKFQIWEPARFRAHLDQATRQLRALRNTPGPAPAAGSRQTKGSFQ